MRAAGRNAHAASRCQSALGSTRCHSCRNGNVGGGRDDGMPRASCGTALRDASGTNGVIYWRCLLIRVLAEFAYHGTAARRVHENLLMSEGGDSLA